MRRKMQKFVPSAHAYRSCSEMPHVEVHMAIITKKKFRSFLQSHLTRHFLRDDALHCPLAIAMGPDVSVSDQWIFHSTCKDSPVRTPRWMRHFQERIDSVPSNTITGTQALQDLDAIR